jgi:hypothetical protein
MRVRGKAAKLSEILTMLRHPESWITLTYALTFRAPIKDYASLGCGLGEVLFEFSRVGNVMRVTAIDVDTNTEIVIAGPATAPQASLQNTALQKLRYVLAKKKGLPR